MVYIVRRAFGGRIYKLDYKNSTTRYCRGVNYDNSGQLMANYEGMLEEIISLYSYRLGRLWDIGMSARSILDGYRLTVVEYDDYACRI